MKMGIESLEQPIELFLPMVSEILRFLVDYGVGLTRISTLKAMILDKFILFLKLYAIPHQVHGPDVPATRAQFIEILCAKAEILRMELLISKRPESFEFDTLQVFKSYEKVEHMLTSIADVCQLGRGTVPVEWTMPDMSPANGHTLQAAIRKPNRRVMSSSTYGDPAQAKRVQQQSVLRPVPRTTFDAAKSFGHRSMPSRDWRSNQVSISAW